MNGSMKHWENIRNGSGEFNESVTGNVQTVMKSKLFKIFGIGLGGLLGIIFICFTIYVILFYPRKAESFEFTIANPIKRVLIATQGSEFKNSLTNILCDSLREASIYIRGIDVRELDEVHEEDWDKILIINSLIVRINNKVNQFITSTDSPEKYLVFVTSGGADWLPPSQFRIEALTSASRSEYIDDLVHLITDWINKENDQNWEPDDYLLALTYFPQVNVETACKAIALEQERYLTIYPDLENMVNRIGYQYLRLEKLVSAQEVLRLNISLFPDSWNVYDSYGEALLANGNRESAISSYQKALLLNPDNKSAKDHLEMLIRE